MEKGFPTGKAPKWHFDTLQAIESVLEKLAGNVEFDWTSQTIVQCLLSDENPGDGESGKTWTRIETKDDEAVWLHLPVPKGKFSEANMSGIAARQELTSQDGRTDLIKLAFTKVEQVQSPALERFLNQHLASFRESSNTKA